MQAVIKWFRYMIWWAWHLVTLRPHLLVGDGPEGPYLRRWHLLPRNRWLSIYLHHFRRDDDDRALHDHPADYLTIILRGGYHEITDGGVKTWHPAGSILRYPAEHRHRVIVSESGRSCWTLFFTGPKRRTWGFWCPLPGAGFRFVPWTKFLARGEYGRTGPGCGAE